MRLLTWQNVLDEVKKDFPECKFFENAYGEKIIYYKNYYLDSKGKVETFIDNESKIVKENISFKEIYKFIKKIEAKNEKKKISRK
jgi:hypothetical protein